MTGWEYPLVVIVWIVALVSAAGWKYLLTVVALATALGFAGARWRYLLVTVMVVTWLAMHLLNYVSRFADRLVDLFEVCWLALFFLALAAPFLRRWRELAVSALGLSFTFWTFVVALSDPARGAVLPNRWLQEGRIADLRLVSDHASAAGGIAREMHVRRNSGEDGAKRKIGECGDHLRSTFYFMVVVVYDPSGEIALPAVERTLAWRLAGRKLPTGPSFIHNEPSGRIGGDLYWIVADGPLG